MALTSLTVKYLKKVHTNAFFINSEGGKADSDIIKMILTANATIKSNKQNMATHMEENVDEWDDIQ